MNKTSPKVSKKEEEALERQAAKKFDFDLVKRCQKGDMVAFGQLVERYQRKVYSVALGMLKNPEDAMDVTQDAFVKVHKYLGNFQGTSSFYTWLYRIVVNLCIDRLRRGGKFLDVELDESINHGQKYPDASAVMSNNPHENPAKVLSRSELAERIRGAIDELPPYHRAVIIMREIEGMSYTEMAKAMKVSKGTIMSRLHHARQKLQRSLAGYLDGDLSVS